VGRNQSAPITATNCSARRSRTVQSIAWANSFSDFIFSPLESPGSCYGTGVKYINPKAKGSQEPLGLAVFELPIKGLLGQFVIPLLCKKAAVPLDDARGRISSYRARATIASQLYNAKEPLSLFELQEWLGHSSPESTRHYTKITPTKLAKSY